jgi:pyrroline-5-carboxylate reductase
VFENRKIAFIGPGAMAEAMIAGLIRKGVARPESLIASGPHPERGEELHARYNIQTATDNAAAARLADVVVISVKPQRLDSVLIGLRGAIQSSALVLSIVAGAPIAKIAGILDHNAVVRSMPNTPAQIGEGITVWTASPAVTEDQREMASQILGALGPQISRMGELFWNMATLSGTGPMYVFLFMDVMVDAGVHLGFPRRVAEQLRHRQYAARSISTPALDPPVHLRRCATRSPPRVVHLRQRSLPG